MLINMSNLKLRCVIPPTPNKLFKVELNLLQFLVMQNILKVPKKEHPKETWNNCDADMLYLEKGDLVDMNQLAGPGYPHKNEKMKNLRERRGP